MVNINVLNIETGGGLLINANNRYEAFMRHNNSIIIILQCANKENRNSY